MIAFSPSVVTASRTHLVVNLGSLSTSIVNAGLIAPGVQLGSGTGNPLLTRVVQLCGGGRVTETKGLDARPLMFSSAQTGGLTASGGNSPRLLRADGTAVTGQREAQYRAGGNPHHPFHVDSLFRIGAFDGQDSSSSSNRVWTGLQFGFRLGMAVRPIFGSLRSPSIRGQQTDVASTLRPRDAPQHRGTFALVI